MGRQGSDAIDVVIRTSKDRRPAGRADRICTETIVKPHAPFRNPVDLRRSIDPATIGADGMGRMVIGHDEKDIWTGAGHGKTFLIC